MQQQVYTSPMLFLPDPQTPTHPHTHTHTHTCTGKYFIFEHVFKPISNPRFFSRWPTPLLKHHPPPFFKPALIIAPSLPSSCALLAPRSSEYKYLVSEVFPSNIRIQSQLGKELQVYTNVPLSKYIPPSTQWANTHLYYNWTLRPLENICTIRKS